MIPMAKCLHGITADRYMGRQDRHAPQEQYDMRDLPGQPGQPGQPALQDQQGLQLLQEGGHHFH